MTRGATHVVAWAYRLSLAIAGPLLLAGLVAHSTHLLQAGVLVVMVTPLVGVIIVAGSMVAVATAGVNALGAVVPAGLVVVAWALRPWRVLRRRGPARASATLRSPTA